MFVKYQSSDRIIDSYRQDTITFQDHPGLLSAVGANKYIMIDLRNEPIQEKGCCGLWKEAQDTTS
jgi:hypothetical protein